MSSKMTPVDFYAACKDFQKGDPGEFRRLLSLAPELIGVTCVDLAVHLRRSLSTVRSWASGMDHPEDEVQQKAVDFLRAKCEEFVHGI